MFQFDMFELKKEAFRRRSLFDDEDRFKCTKQIFFNIKCVGRQWQSLGERETEIEVSASYYCY